MISRAPRTYTIFWMSEGWGTVDTEITAVDIKSAIDQLLEGFYAKFGTEKSVYIVKVIES